MKHVKTLLFSALTLSLLASCGCEPSAPIEGEDVVEITDLVGRKVTFDRNNIKKVACIGAGALRLYSYVGDVHMLAGVEDIDRGVEGANRFEGASRPYYDLNLEYFKTLPTVGRGGPANQAAEPEKILDAEPDLIISEYEDVKKADDLQEMTNIPVLVTSYGGSNVFSDQVKSSLTMLGAALKKEAKASALISYINSCKAELEDKVKDIPLEDSPTMYIGCLGNWGKQSFRSTSKNYVPFTVSHIKNGAANLATDDKGLIDLEELLTVDPDKIIFDAAGYNLFLDEYDVYKGTYSGLNAFKSGELYLEMAFNAYYTNLEIALMNCYYIASIAYPEAYEGFSIADKSDEITEKFLGTKMYSDIASKRYSYGGYQKLSIK